MHASGRGVPPSRLPANRVALAPHARSATHMHAVSPQKPSPAARTFRSTSAAPPSSGSVVCRRRTRRRARSRSPGAVATTSAGLCARLAHGDAHPHGAARPQRDERLELDRARRSRDRSGRASGATRARRGPPSARSGCRCRRAARRRRACTRIAGAPSRLAEEALGIERAPAPRKQFGRRWMPSMLMSTIVCFLIGAVPDDHVARDAPREDVRGRVEAHRLLEHGERPRQALQVLVRRRARRAPVDLRLDARARLGVLARGGRAPTRARSPWSRGRRGRASSPRRGPACPSSTPPSSSCVERSMLRKSPRSSPCGAPLADDAVDDRVEPRDGAAIPRLRRRGDDGRDRHERAELRHHAFHRAVSACADLVGLRRRPRRRRASCRRSPA